MKKSKKSLIVLSLILSVLLLASTVAYADDSFDGKVDIGGYSLYANVVGAEKPTIIFESGYGDDHTVWSQVQSLLGDKYRMFSYDRAGLGLSDASPLKRTTLNQVHELHKLLEEKDIKGPYIFVAHSMGGFNARVYASEFPNEVAGVVFVDATQENALERTTEFLNANMPDLVDLFLGQFVAEGSLEDVLESEQQVINAGDSLRNIPITVLSSNNNGLGLAYDEFSLSMQSDLVKLSNNSKQIIVPTGHYIQLEQPQIVADSIKEIFQRIEDQQ